VGAVVGIETVTGFGSIKTFSLIVICEKEIRGTRKLNAMIAFRNQLDTMRRIGPPLKRWWCGGTETAGKSVTNSPLHVNAVNYCISLYVLSREVAINP